MSQRSFAIVTPSFNQGRFLRRTIESVLSQDVGELDYFIADGRSTDETVDVLKSYGNRIRWVSEKDDGQADAVNKGIKATSAPLIGWLNSDDVYEPGALAKVESYFARHPEVDVVYGRACHIDAQDSIIEPYPTEPWDLARLREICYLCQPAVFFRRRVVKRCGGLDATLRYCMDYEYWLRLAEGGCQFAAIPFKLAGSRLYPTNKTLGSRLAVHAEINNMLLARYGAVPRRWLVGYAVVLMQQWGIPTNVRYLSGLVRRLVTLYVLKKWPVLVDLDSVLVQTLRPRRAA
ncbi:PGL/p-HBAD biosynthesis glycosyltransferase [Planctomycetes bacterium Pan216]|uniref:PGL/p-HBAD biosynthesis glycosyltransferase n=1 Tax=Kolteria novifilia TaxID=2527975 RepID=A0A518B1W8_9BACT|nr:PGL/p-HBAD biosynthesis glycosyltransferase [Planctomycetes bacterium Pan216]